MKKFFLLLFLSVTICTFSQTDTGDLEAYLGNIITNMPGDSGDNYKEPTAGELSTWEDCINALFGGFLATARTHADAVNYRIVEYINTGLGSNTGLYYVLEEKTPQSNYWGTYVFAQGTTRGLVLQAPHSRFDFNTGKEAIYSFVRLHPLGLFLNGTHRCNHNTASTCSGTTTVCGCGGSDPFKISDMAHNTNTVWQKTTELTLATFSNAVFVQLHGFTKLSTDPYVILSNGTDQTPTSIDYAVQIKDELFNQDATLTFKIAHLDSWTRLVGFTNTQGRFINQSANPCNTAATSTTGRFIHIEQEKSKLREDATGWEKMFQALNTVFTSTLSNNDVDKVTVLSEIPFKNSFSFSAESVKQITVFNLLGKTVYHQKNRRNQIAFTLDTSKYPSGVYILQLDTEQGVIRKKILRE
ncbi:MAG: T9SS type A sorting domain-containing protein [Flavobacteriaceae bacterium]|nr:T9SS type A sorting domain-containing protein [Flavobacteriaceae bacterium]